MSNRVITQSALRDLLAMASPKPKVNIGTNDFGDAGNVVFVDNISDKPVSADDVAVLHKSTVQISVYAQDWDNFNSIKEHIRSLFPASFIDSNTTDGTYFQSDATIELYIRWGA